MLAIAPIVQMGMGTGSGMALGGCQQSQLGAHWLHSEAAGCDRHPSTCVCTGVTRRAVPATVALWSNGGLWCLSFQSFQTFQVVYLPVVPCSDPLILSHIRPVVLLCFITSFVRSTRGRQDAPAIVIRCQRRRGGGNHYPARKSRLLHWLC